MKLSAAQFKTLLMNDQEPEWASNIKRGLATYLQMNMERVTPQKLMFFKDEEVFYVWHRFCLVPA